MSENYITHRAIFLWSAENGRFCLLHIKTTSVDCASAVSTSHVTHDPGISHARDLWEFRISLVEIRPWQHYGTSLCHTENSEKSRICKLDRLQRIGFSKITEGFRERISYDLYTWIAYYSTFLYSNAIFKVWFSTEKYLLFKMADKKKPKYEW